MMLRRLTVEDVDVLLRDGNYTRAASLAVSLSKDDPLVAMLARELATVGNKNRKGRGARAHEPKPTPLNVVSVLCASMLFDDLILARRIVDGKVDGIDEGGIKEARSLLRKHKLHNVDKWQQFPAQALTVAANRHGVEEKEIWR